MQSCDPARLRTRFFASLGLLAPLLYLGAGLPLPAALQAGPGALALRRCCSWRWRWASAGWAAICLPGPGRRCAPARCAPPRCRRCCWRRARRWRFCTARRGWLLAVAGALPRHAALGGWTSPPRWRRLTPAWPGRRRWRCGATPPR